MRNGKCILAAFLLVLIAFTFLSGCNNDGSTSGAQTSTFSLSGAPAGNCTVAVYNSSSLPKTKTEYASMVSGSIAGATNSTSPFDLNWWDGIKSGSHLVVVINAGKIKFALVNFNKNGDGGSSWPGMTDYTSLPY